MTTRKKPKMKKKDEKEMNSLKAWLGHKYPCTIIRDRYNGVYSGGAFVAFPLPFDKVPPEIDGGDVDCASFWVHYEKPYGVGDTPDKAYWDLVNKSLKRYRTLKDIKGNGGAHILELRKRWIDICIEPDTQYIIAFKKNAYGAIMATGVFTEPLGEFYEYPSFGSPLLGIPRKQSDYIVEKFSDIYAGCVLDHEDDECYYLKYEGTFKELK